MNRDNVLFGTIGVLVGFIGGYIAHEVMAARQPPLANASMVGHPNVPGAPVGMPVAPGAPPATNAGGPTGATPPAAGPAMEEITKLREQVEANPQDADAILQLAHLNFDIASWARARELYERYLALRPRTADVLTDLGVCLRELGELEPALVQFRDAAKLQPDHWQSRFNEVVVLGIDLGRFDEATAVLAELRALRPGNQDVERLAAEIERRKAAA